MSRSTQIESGALNADPLLRKDQQRAMWAYDRAKTRSEDDKDKLKEYENAVQTFAATMLRSGLAVAVSVLERDSRRDAPKYLLQDLAALSLPGILTSREPDAWERWPAQVRGVSSLGDYMLITREFLKRAEWLRRACRAVRAVMDAQQGDKELMAAGASANA